MSSVVDFGARVRLDKWLWAARFFKTRSLAARAIAAGHVLLNGARAKPAKDVRIDDLVKIDLGGVSQTLRVRLVSEVRESAGIAQTRYAETDESRIARSEAQERRRLYREPALGMKGRPDKRARRQLSRLGDE
jgi:ribosome-associated heat shock protein Hsp15